MTPLRNRPARIVAATTLALCAAFTSVATHAAGLDIHADAEAADVGLPVYPGAVKKPFGHDDTPGFKFGLWGGSFGLKLAIVGYQSTDGVDAVAGFYRDALAKFGPVLDCSNAKKPRNDGRGGVGASVDIDSGKDARDKSVTCDNSSVDVPGERIYKVGSQADQHMVEIKPLRAGGVAFQMLRIEMRGND